MAVTLAEYSQNKIREVKRIDLRRIKEADKTELKKIHGSVMQALYVLFRDTYNKWESKCMRSAQSIHKLRAFITEAVTAIQKAGRLRRI
jgi:MOSC domain-containing protein YiiM